MLSSHINIYFTENTTGGGTIYLVIQKIRQHFKKNWSTGHLGADFGFEGEKYGK